MECDLAAIGHGVARIRHQINQHLHNTIAITFHLRQVGGEIGDDRNVGPTFKLMCGEEQCIANDLVEVGWLIEIGGRVSVSAEGSHNLGAAPAVATDHFKIRSQLIGFQRSVGHLPQRHLAHADDHLQRRIHLVRHTG